MSETGIEPQLASREVVRDGARLAALRELGLLDAPASATFDRLTRLARASLGVPVSLVSLVDEDRQFFLSQQGLSGEWAEFRQSPLSHSFCQYAVADKRPLLISDARDSPLADNLAVRDLDVIAYAGVPLVLDDGHAIGAVCAIDHKPREWTQAEVALLEDLTATVKEIIDLRVGLVDAGLHDRLTGLPNRTLLVEQCQQFLNRTEGGHRVAVMCLGLDDFTQINQAFGTERADAILRAAGQRLTESMRETDLLGRLRGDMFVILADRIDNEEQALGLAGRIRRQLAETPLSLDGAPLVVNATVGVALPREDSRAADLITEAAAAMRQAKRNHTRTQTSRDGWTEVAAARVRLRQALGGALSRGEIRPVFQPVVALDDGRIRGYECLARWRHPDLGDVSPAEFIPVAETTADIIPIGEHMLECACLQVAGWRRAGHDVYATVNLAPLQLEQPHIADVIGAALARHELPGSALVLEITEGVLLEDDGMQAHALRRLRDIGIRIALDDFGTGYSALGYLKRFPIDIIKIDRSFIMGIEDDRYDTALIQAILAMAQGMHLDIVAEGIETQGQHRLLRLLGCDLGQGYLYSPPQEIDAVDPTTTYA